jgi:Ca2+-binding EF-hand superfamily protein
MFLRTFRIAVLVAAGLAVSTGAQAQPVNVDAFVQQWDADHDGTLSLEEVKKAAIAQFETLDRKHTGTLTRSQLAGLVSYQQFQKANTEKNRTLDQNEFLALVEKLCRAADKDNDGTLDKKELQSSAGKALLRLFAVRQGPVL